MENEKRESPLVRHARSGSQFLLVMASLVVVVAGLKAAKDLLIPILLAAFLSLVCVPPMRAMMRRGLPSGLAVVVMVLVVLIALAGVTTLLGNSVAQFSSSTEGYNERILEILDGAQSWLARIGVEVTDEQLSEMLDSRELLSLMASTLKQLLSALSSVLLILIIVIFMLFEALELPGKLRLIYGDAHADLSQYASVTDSIYEYMHLKTLLGLMTGIPVAVLCLVLGVDFALLWGLVAFLFNYIPNIGSILAAIPPVLLALIQHGPGKALIVGAGFLVINMVIGNIVEPKMMGKRMGLSSAVVVLSLIFWNWVLGPVGMVLSIPLTMVVKIMLEQSADLRAVAILLGNESAERAPAD